MFIPTVPVAALLPGDVITADDYEITVDSIEPLAGGRDEPPLIRVYGRITKGYGVSPRTQRWTRVADETVDIERNRHAT